MMATKAFTQECQDHMLVLLDMSKDDQLQDGNYSNTKRSPNAIIRDLQSKMKGALRKIGIKCVAEQKKYLLQPLNMTTFSLRIKNHKRKDNFPGRLVENQIGDLMYKTSKILTQIQNPLTKKRIHFFRTRNRAMMSWKKCRLTKIVS